MNEHPASDDASVRLFVALPVPEDVRRGLAALSSPFRNQDAGRRVKWVRQENMHLTLRFLGQVPSRVIGDLERAISRAVEGTHPFCLRLGAAGCFPNSRAPRVIWVGLSGELEGLLGLQRCVVQSTAAWGERENRDFHPHITLGRVGTRDKVELRRIVEWIDRAEVPPSGSWSIDAVYLMRSELAASGAKHITLATFPLAARP